MVIFKHKSVKIGLSLVVAVWLLGYGAYGALYVTKQTIEVESKAANPVKVMAVGDMNCDPGSKDLGKPDKCQEESVARLVRNRKPKALLLLGDLQYEDGSLEKFQNNFDKTWGDLKSISYPAPGNHEYGTAEAAGYYEYYASGAPVDVSLGYYKFNLGSWSIYSLNSNCDKIDCSISGEQLVWLDQQLGKDSSKCQITYWHHPLVTSGNYFSNPEQTTKSLTLRQTLDNHKVELVLNGHDHLYERFAPQTSKFEVRPGAPRQFTAGAGGKTLYPVKGIATNSEYRNAEVYGALELMLYPGYYEWKYLDVGGAVLDSGKQQCWEQQ